MTRDHLIITLYAGATWCLIAILGLRGLYSLLDDPWWGAIDLSVAAVAFWSHVKFERYEGFA